MSSRSENKRIRIPERTLFNLTGWLVGLLGTMVYLLTLEPTASFWDCGEFIATSYKLQVSHPPGAPLYQLLARIFMLFAGSDTSMVAWWSNALSAVAGGLTAMFLFWTVARVALFFKSDEKRLTTTFLPAFVAAACYLFCDTAWFSAVESEVYSLSMLFSSVIVWAMVRWSQCENTAYASRWLLLVIFLLSLSLCVHLLGLLTIPALVVIYFLRRRQVGRFPLKALPVAAVLFVAGVSPYAIVPIRAAADPPINMGNPSTMADFRSYMSREQYEHAPLLYGRCYNSPVVQWRDGKPVYAPEMDMLFPRMWKRGPHAEQYYSDWCGRHGKMVNVGGKEYYKPSFGDNMVIFGGYQLGYMYLRYLMWNFSGRYNDRQGYGNLQKGQFITGIAPIDKLYVGSSQPLPESMPRAGHNRYFMLPLLLGVLGCIATFKRNKGWGWIVMTLFLSSGVLLSVYLNHPLYEPRERDYAYVLSFYAFAIWIGIGALALIEWVRKKAKGKTALVPATGVLLLAVPLLMAFQNWDDHDRSGRHVACDSARNLLESCDQGAILFTLADNDTYPLWYLQEVEGYRTDVQIVNLSLLGSDNYSQSIAHQLALRDTRFCGLDSLMENQGPYRRMMTIIEARPEGCFPVHFSHYAASDHRVSFDGRMQLCGIGFRLADSVSTDSVDLDRSFELMTGKMQWHPLSGVYIDETSCEFLLQYWRDALTSSKALASAGRGSDARALLDTACAAVPPDMLCDPQITFDIAEAYAFCGDSGKHQQFNTLCRRQVDEQLAYYGAMKPSMQYYIPYIIKPLQSLKSRL
ncbi:MAG: DUF2723 domain-containing protein [Bacteroidales bacterium]|nr:DUF2723 domain-containing protein [Bacteroidales bacterium]